MNTDPSARHGTTSVHGGRIPLFVLNMHGNFTGVSATAAAVTLQQLSRYDVQLVGRALPGLSLIHI